MFKKQNECLTKWIKLFKNKILIFKCFTGTKRIVYLDNGLVIASNYSKLSDIIKLKLYQNIIEIKNKDY